MAETSIQWTDKVWNPVTGCDKVSPGCRFCYAEVIAERFWATQYPPVEEPSLTEAQYAEWVRAHGAETADLVNLIGRPRRFTDVQTHEDRLLEPLKWRKPARVFVNSMSDLFHGDVPDEFIDRVFAVMALCPQHTFQVLTKRPERMRDYLNTEDRVSIIEEPLFEMHTDNTINAIALNNWPLRNVWLGVSVETQQYADERIPILLQTPAAVRFISAEPLLGPVNVARIAPLPGQFWNALGGWHSVGHRTERLDWVIVGGESGHGARPCDLAWVRSIVQQCQAAGTRVFVKQLGADPRTTEPTAWPNGRITPYPHLRPHLNDRKGGDIAEFPPDLQVREYPPIGDRP